MNIDDWRGDFDEWRKKKESAEKEEKRKRINFLEEKIRLIKKILEREIIELEMERLRVKKKLHKEVCLNCIRYPDNSIEQMAQGRRPIVKYKVLDVEKSKEQHKPVFKEVERKSWLTCDGCRVLKCKQAFNREIKCVLEVRFKLS